MTGTCRGINLSVVRHSSSDFFKKFISQGLLEVSDWRCADRSDSKYMYFDMI